MHSENQDSEIVDTGELGFVSFLVLFSFPCAFTFAGHRCRSGLLFSGRAAFLVAFQRCGRTPALPLHQDLFFREERMHKSSRKLLMKYLLFLVEEAHFFFTRLCANSLFFPSRSDGLLLSAFAHRHIPRS